MYRWMWYWESFIYIFGGIFIDENLNGEKTYSHYAQICHKYNIQNPLWPNGSCLKRIVSLIMLSSLHIVIQSEVVHDVSCKG